MASISMSATTQMPATHAPVSFSSGAAMAYQASGGSRRPSGGSETRGSARPSPHASAQGTPDAVQRFAASKPPLRGQGDAASQGKPPPGPSRGDGPQGRTSTPTGASRRLQGSRQPVGTPLSQRGPSPHAGASPLQTGAREQIVGTGLSRQGSGGGYGIHFGDPLAVPADTARNAPPTGMSGKSRRSNASYERMPEGHTTVAVPADTAPPTGMSGKSQMSNASYERMPEGYTTASEEATPPRRTLRRMYEDKSHYQKDEFLYGFEPAPSVFKPEASMRNTLFHKGFYRGIVNGQDALRKEHEQDRDARSQWRTEPRHERLAGLTKHHFLRQDPPKRGDGRRHFEEASSIVIRGPESVIPRGPNMEGTISEKVLLMNLGHRMKGLLREGLVIPPKESVKDVFGHMFGYAVKDMYQPLERGPNAGTPSFTGDKSKGNGTVATGQNGNVMTHA